MLSAAELVNEDRILAHMSTHMQGLVPELEMATKADLIARINRLKLERDAVVLGHNYMEPALFHYVADLRGDSLELCRKAKASTHSVLVFCGVEFMAETAKILNPDRKVLIPSQKAGCSLAASITRDDVRALKERFPDAPVVTYINTYADVKAETDVCCTSSNAADIVSALDSDQVIFIPDEYLARNVARETGKSIIFPRNFQKGSPSDAGQADFIGWPGKCEVHDQFRPEDVDDARRQFQDLVVLAHPECPPEVVEKADFSGSTSAMIRYVKERPGQRMLLLTECSMADNIIAETREDRDHDDVIRMCSVRCPHMAQISLEQTLSALENLTYEVTVADDVMEPARRSIERMLEMSR